MSETHHNVDGSAVLEIAALKAAGTAPKLLDREEIHHVLVPEGYQSVIHDLRKADPDHDPMPVRPTGTHRPDVLESFIHLATTHRDDLHTTVWIEQQSAKITAILNDHAGDATGWGDHRVVLQLKHTPEWTHWMSKNGAYMSQEAFAEHLQDGIHRGRSSARSALADGARERPRSHTASWDWTRSKRSRSPISLTPRRTYISGRRAVCSARASLPMSAARGGSSRSPS